MGVGSTEVETGLSFGHKMHSGMSLLGVGDNLRPDSGGSELGLLRTTPFVWMGQHKLDATGH